MIIVSNLALSMLTDTWRWESLKGLKVYLIPSNHGTFTASFDGSDSVVCFHRPRKSRAQKGAGQAIEDLVFGSRTNLDRDGVRGEFFKPGGKGAGHGAVGGSGGRSCVSGHVDGLDRCLVPIRGRPWEEKGREDDDRDD